MDEKWSHVRKKVHVQFGIITRLYIPAGNHVSELILTLIGYPESLYNWISPLQHNFTSQV